MLALRKQETLDFQADPPVGLLTLKTQICDQEPKINEEQVVEFRVMSLNNKVQQLLWVCHRDLLAQIFQFRQMRGKNEPHSNNKV